MLNCCFYHKQTFLSFSEVTYLVLTLLPLSMALVIFNLFLANQISIIGNEMIGKISRFEKVGFKLDSYE